MSSWHELSTGEQQAGTPCSENAPIHWESVLVTASYDLEYIAVAMNFTALIYITQN